MVRKKKICALQSGWALLRSRRWRRVEFSETVGVGFDIQIKVKPNNIPVSVSRSPVHRNTSWLSTQSLLVYSTLSSVSSLRKFRHMNQFIYIRIRNTLLLPIPTSNDTANLTPVNAQLAGHLYLIEGTYDDIQRYAGTTVDWVIKVAHYICDPLGEGQLYTHTMGTPSD